jgi:trk system potassium uptake protein TrkH
MMREFFRRRSARAVAYLTGIAKRVAKSASLSVAARIVLALALLIAISTVLLTLPGVGAEKRISMVDAFFTSTSALTVTSLSVIAPASELTLLGQVMLIAMVQVGAVSYAFLASLLVRLAGRRLSLPERISLASSLGLDSPADITRILTHSTYVILLAEGIGGALLALNWHLRDIVPGPRALFYGLFHAVSAFCNAGFELFSGSVSYPEGVPTDTPTMAILSVLVLLGGLGIPVYLDLMHWKARRRLSLHTKLTLVAIAALVLIGWLGLYIAESGQDGVLAGMSPGQKVARTLFQSLVTRTAGIAGLPRFAHLAPASRLLLIGLMFVGCAPASTGGGITTGTLGVLVVALWAATRGTPSPRIWGRRISSSTVGRACAVLTVSLLLITCATWLVLATNPVSLTNTLFEVVSAFSTTGLSLGITTELNWFGRLVLIGVMFCGRLGALTVSMALIPHAYRSVLVEYPEEPVLVG